MQVLIASLYLPWPLTEGGRVSQYRTMEALRDACDFTFIAPVFSLSEEMDADHFARTFPNVQVRAVRCFEAEKPRLGQSLRKLARKIKGYFVSPNHSELLRQKTNEVNALYPFCPLPPQFITAVGEELAKGYDIFQVEFTQAMTLATLTAGLVPSIFVHHQPHFVYVRRFLETNGIGGPNARYMTERTLQEELLYSKIFDQIIVFSEVDRAALESLCPSLDVKVSPFPTPEDCTSAATLFAEPVRRFVFVASESHQPNADGLRWFMSQAWPEIRNSLPGAKVEVIGKWSLSARARLPHLEDICFAGFVPELLKSLRNKIMIVPVWVGSGIRTKILAAWSAYCPVVTTTVGVEGLPGRSGEHFVVADDATEFAKACIDLSQDIKKLNRIAANGLDLVQKHYSLSAVRQTRLEIYEKLLKTNQQSKLPTTCQTVAQAAILK